MLSMGSKSDSALSPLKGGSEARRENPYVYWVSKGVPSYHLPLYLTVAQSHKPLGASFNAV